jgi:hypothetical protein
MPQQATFIDDSIDRIQSVFKDAEGEIQKLQKSAVKRRNEIQKKAEKRSKDIQKQFRKMPAVKKAEQFRADAQKQIDSNVESFMGKLPVASRYELVKMDRRIKQLTRKLNALEKAQGNS